VGAPCSSDRGPLDHILPDRHPGPGLLIDCTGVGQRRVRAVPVRVFGKYVCAMLTDVATAGQEALAQRTDSTGAWSTALHTTLLAAQAPLWVWLRQGGKVLIACAL
jgi:hypothetical protein